ncbi:RES domain-containing protein [Aeromicrobium phragmitis]|uniref:RES domain-containing protein n=1 Tax=Aeromicrobium phragmitis TaxID=2478914 RepID=A0A3L8PMW1_9ACTN|nr:RES family NAD+ phosphorylase [Aeromicrobium phragmitis]RLV56093.1 RES domain-containing protein [Aeromicrobium phragmitis]
MAADDPSELETKLPPPDPEVIASVEPEVWTSQDVLWRIHATGGEHPSAWNALRNWGPLVTARFDPWSPPPTKHDDAVGYFGWDWATCLAEVFQTTRSIHVEPGRGVLLTGFQPQRSLSLLDLRGEYPVRVGASHLINSGPRHRCRAWAQALRQAHPNLDGMVYTGIAGRSCVVLYTAEVFPTSPTFSRQLHDPAIAAHVADAAHQIGYRLRGW